MVLLAGTEAADAGPARLTVTGMVRAGSTCVKECIERSGPVGAGHDACGCRQGSSNVPASPWAAREPPTGLGEGEPGQPRSDTGSRDCPAGEGISLMPIFA